MNEIPIARIHGPGQVKLDSIREPYVGDDDILIAVSRCGICGSDLSYAKLGGLPGAPTPMPIGHEFSGSIVKLGDSVQGFNEGDRVVVNPEAAGNGIGSTGNNGAFSPLVCFRNVSQDPNGILSLPAELDYETGALVEPLSVAMHGLNQGKCSSDDKIAIFGGGPIGLSAALVAQYFGAKDVIVVELSEKRLEIAEKLGAIPCHAGKLDVREFLMEAHGSRSNIHLGEQPSTNFYVEATGSGDVFKEIINMGCNDSRVSVIGVHFEPVKLNLLKLLMTEMTVTASLAYKNEFPAVIEMLASEKLDISAMITHRLPLSDFEKAFSIAGEHEKAVKVMIDCQN